MGIDKILTSEQMFRFELLEKYSSVSEAKEAYAFIMQKNELSTSDVDWHDYKPHRPNQYMPDGVYFICEDCLCALVNTVGHIYENSPKNSSGVGLKIGDFSVRIAAEDVDCGSTALTVKSLGDSAKRFLNCKEAVMDLNGSGNLDSLKYILCPQIELTDGWYIPSLGELLRIFLYRHVIDEALLTISGKPFKNEYYWTSTFCNCIRSYVVFMGDGTVNDMSACELMNRVRLVSKFL